MPDTPTTTTIPPKTHICPTCNKPYLTLQRLNTHRAAAHGYRNRARQRDIVNNGGKVRPVKAKLIIKRQQRATDLAEIVSRLYPRGIPTDNVAELTTILLEIDQLRARLEGS